MKEVNKIEKKKIITKKRNNLKEESKEAVIEEKSKEVIKVLEQEDKRSFFSILTPRVVKVEIKLKDVTEEAKPQPVKEKSKKENTVQDYEGCGA